jgi:hypothetical protein
MKASMSLSFARSAVVLLLVAGCGSSKGPSPRDGEAPDAPVGGEGGTGGGGGGASGKGGAGGGAVGGAGGAPVGGAGGGAPSTAASVLERNKNPSRDGHFIDARMTRANAARLAPEGGFRATFNGAMWASPLYLEDGPGGKGVFFAETIENEISAHDESTGAVVWSRKVGPAAPSNGVNCGQIHPLGIIATPVIDAQTRTIFLSSAEGQDVIEAQMVHALSVDDGTERAGWPVDVSKAVSFDPKPHNPRSALSLVGGIVYVAYGGHVGDCGDYHGRVVAIDSRDPAKVAGWATAGVGEGIWASGGMASDGNGVIAITGNRTGGGGPHQDSEEVVRVTGMATVKPGRTDVFFPGRWDAMDSADADFGSSNAIVASLPGNTPSRIVVALSKDGHVYLLDPQNFGGMDGQLLDFQAAGTNMAFHTAPTAYNTAAGLHIAFTVGAGARCPAGGGGGDHVVMSLLIAPGSPPKPQILWCAPTGGTSAPISTTVDGSHEAIVWYMSGAQLRGVDGETGQPVYTDDNSYCTAERWTSPIAVKGRIIVGSEGRLCAWGAK